MYISKIKLTNYRNFREFEMTFNKGLNVIIGANNAGKTNLLNAINLLQNPDHLTIHDYNKNDLIMKFNNEYIDKAPSIIVEYEIFHEIDQSNFNDESILKLIAFIGMDRIIKVEDEKDLQEGQADTSSSSSDKYRVLANIKMKYQLNEKYLDKYKEYTNNSQNINEYIENLKLCLQFYQWTFENAETSSEATKEDVTNIFKIDYIMAERHSDIIVQKAKSEIKNHIKKEDRQASLKELREKISSLIKVELEDVLDKLDELISNENNEIGLAKGNISIFQDVKSSSSLSESYNIDVKDTKNDCIIPLSHNGVGYNNLVYMYMLIKLIELSEERDFRILCLEEPEAHLHPAMQYKLFSYLRTINEENSLNHQIFVTTHSSNITAVSGLENMYVIDYKRAVKIEGTEQLDNNAVSVSLEKQFRNDNAAQKHLAKFLDVTRSDMLFADKVIFVEGLAEKLLLPMFMKKEGFSYEDNHISIVEIGGKHFNYFLRTFIDNDLNRKILCITDNDFEWVETIDKVKYIKSKADYCFKKLHEIDNEKRPTHTKYFADKPNINYTIQSNGGSTLEDELFFDNFINIDVAKKLLNIAFPKTLKEFFESICEENDGLCIHVWNNKRDEIPTKSYEKITTIMDMFLKAIENYPDDSTFYNKLFFSELFLAYAKGKKGDIALKILVDEDLNSIINTPVYIKEGLDWLAK